MQFDLVIANLLSPVILFFVLGLLAKVVRSEPEIPKPISQGLSLYLLVGIGFIGGVKLTENPLTGELIGLLTLAVAGSAIVPLWVYAILRRKLNPADAPQRSSLRLGQRRHLHCCDRIPQGRQHRILGCYDRRLALMESPAIITGVICYRIATYPQSRRPARPQLNRLVSAACSTKP